MKRIQSYVKGKKKKIRKYHLTSVNFMYLIVIKMLFKIFQVRQLKKIISYTQPYQFAPIRLLIQIYKYIALK